jgi:putative membrane protein
MSNLWLWLKALHIVAFAAWMAGLWYLPRLFVYHSQVPVGSETSEKFKVMERRLLRAITTPAMVATLVLGIALASVTGAWSDGWLHLKIVLVLALAATHGVMARMLKGFAADQRPASEKFFRWLNEVPTALFIAIVFVAVFRPF